MVKGDMFRDVAKIINKWKPLKRYKGELASYPDIRDFIDDKINAKKRTKVSVKAKNTLAKTDISVGNDKVAIEIKYNLDGAGKVRYLVDEIRTQSKAYSEGLIVLLLGKTNKSDMHDLEDGIKDVRKNLNRNRIYKFPVKIIEKSLNELRKGNKAVKKKAKKKVAKKKVAKKKVAKKVRKKVAKKVRKKVAKKKIVRKKITKKKRRSPGLWDW